MLKKLFFPFSTHSENFPLPLERKVFIFRGERKERIPNILCILVSYALTDFPDLSLFSSKTIWDIMLYQIVLECVVGVEMKEKEKERERDVTFLICEISRNFLIKLSNEEKERRRGGRM